MSVHLSRLARMDMETVNELLEEASQRDPRTHTYGLYSVASPPAPIGIFFWFATPAELVRGVVLARALDDEPEEEELEAQMLAADKAVGHVAEDCTKALQHLDERLCWAGTYKALSNGDSEFARELRADFRCCLEEEDEHRDHEEPIRSDETQDWLEHLEGYGH